MSHDIPLFEGIISDLFPGVELPKPDYGALETAVIQNIEKRNLQAVPYSIEKIIQVKRVNRLYYEYIITLKCLNIGTLKTIDFPFVPDGKSMVFRCPNI